MSPRPVGTIRSLGRTEGQIIAAGLSDTIQSIPQLVAGNKQTVEKVFATEKMAKRAMRLMYEWLWFFPTYKMSLSLRVTDNVLTIMVKHSPESRGRRGRK